MNHDVSLAAPMRRDAEMLLEKIGANPLSVRLEFAWSMASSETAESCSNSSLSCACCCCVSVAQAWSPSKGSFAFAAVQPVMILGGW